jgi:DNA-binding transcriptional ArsR family regulator
MEYKKLLLIEKIFKSLSNKKRINILLVINDNPLITLEEIAKKLKINYKTLSIHIAKLDNAGLIYKNYKSHYVEHKLTPYGEKAVKIITKIFN